MTDDAGRWRAWKEETFGNDYMIWHDGLYTAGVASLTGEQREAALTLLRLGLSLGDAHAAEALAAMGDASTVGSMRAKLDEAQGTEQVRLALAIHELGPDPSLARYLIDVLQSPLHWSHRIDAAMGLRRFAGADDEEALLQAVAEDPDYLVRYHAAESLLIRWDLQPTELTGHPEIFARVCGPKDDAPLEPADFVRFREARAMLERLRDDRGRG
ncbi:MAG: HEAT repeat domain-containing protein [Polyangiaceae bacterium]|nr:HEAT repeat domain-containing protein [Polyangiaceae bacterium]